jgi:hypothetical protein
MPKIGRRTVEERNKIEESVKRWQTQLEEGKLAYKHNKSGLARGEALAVVLVDLVEDTIEDFFNRHRYYIDQMDSEEWSLFASAMLNNDLLKTLADDQLLESLLPDNYVAKIITQ